MEPVERRFDTKETARIIQRALEIQRRGPETSATEQGLTLNELEGVARESGIDPALIRRAAQELSAETADRTGLLARLFVGGPLRAAASAGLSAEVSPAALETLLSSLQSITGDSGNGSIVGRSLMWKSYPGSYVRYARGKTVTVRPREGGGAEARVEEDLTGALGGLFGGIVGGLGLGGGLGVGLGVGIAALGSPLFAALVPVGFLIGAWQLARGIFIGVRRRRARSAARILETIRAALESSP